MDPYCKQGCASYPSTGFRLYPYQDNPKYRDLIAQILQSLLLKLYINNDGKWAIAQTKPLTSSIKTLQDDELLKNSFKYEFNYSEIVNEIFVNYSQKEVNDKYQKSDESFVGRVSTKNNLAEYLHLIKKQKTFNSLHSVLSEAQTYSDRLAYIYGDRFGKITLSTFNRFFDSTIGDIVQVSRTKIPGFEYDKDIERTKDVIIQDISKDLNEVTINFNDQKGIEDNSGSW